MKGALGKPLNQRIKLASDSGFLACLSILAIVGCSAQVALKPGPRSEQSSSKAILKTSGQEVATMQVTIYLLFAGNCKDAMNFYHAIFGGKLTMTTVGDSPMKDAFPISMHARVVNARLKSDLVDISASDWLRPTESPVRGNMVSLYLSGGSSDDTKAIFSKLSEGAEITDPLRDQPFGLYGALNDKFGNRWRFHSEKH